MECAMKANKELDLSFIDHLQVGAFVLHFMLILDRLQQVVEAVLELQAHRLLVCCGRYGIHMCKRPTCR
jgi:hypothetical protein